MTVDDYFLPVAANHADLSGWSSLLPPNPRVFRTNFFGDAFILDGLGAIHVLERAACTSKRIAESAEEFWERLLDDKDGWQLRPLVHRCRNEGLTIGPDQCYAFKTPVFAGGAYTPENIWVANWQEWFALTADLYSQIKDLPEGAKIRVKFVD